MHKLPLTRSLSVADGTHILYFYKSLDAYIENAVAFITTGIDHGQQVIFIDNASNSKLIQDCLPETVDRDMICFIDSHEHYQIHRDFDPARILTRLRTVIGPYMKRGTAIRMWGQIHIEQYRFVPEELDHYECVADAAIGELGYTTVCAFDANRIPAHIQMTLLETHEHFMTDDQFVRSPLYKMDTRNNSAAYPSISMQRNIESEIDFYKQKLDFAHVVSHEVRNPLTVVKAYAKLLYEDEANETRKARLLTIMNYCTAIDNELSHIISTEEMLTTDAVWERSHIRVLPPINEVIEMMTVKALTQNIGLQADVRLNGDETSFLNLHGVKLILTNLLSNAIKYSLEGQVVYLKVTNEIGTLLVEVTDHGVGMSDAQQQKLFRKYEKMHQEVNGQGIGLFMVKQLVDHFDGSIKVKSELGKGSTFTVMLPLS